MQKKNRTGVRKFLCDLADPILTSGCDGGRTAVRHCAQSERQSSHNELFERNSRPDTVDAHEERQDEKQQHDHHWFPINQNIGVGVIAG